MTVGSRQRTILCRTECQFISEHFGLHGRNTQTHKQNNIAEIIGLFFLVNSRRTKITTLFPLILIAE